VKRFDYFEPRTLDEAVALLAKPNAQALAGGTDLLVELKEHLRHAERVVNIKKVAGLTGLTHDSAGLRIGALATARDVELSPVVKERYRGLLQSVRELGSIQVRYRATIIGNICRASPSGETLAPLLVRLVDEAIASTTEGLDYFMSRGVTPRFTTWCPEPRLWRWLPCRSDRHPDR